VVNNWLNSIQARLYPATCVLCGARGESNRDLCAGCFEDLPRQGSSCGRCGLRAPGTAGELLCAACLRDPPAFDRTRVLYDYAPPVDQMIRQLKYAGRLHLARLFGMQLATLAAEVPAADCVVPVPLHRSRLRERGFNQAIELARPVARALAAPLDTRSCYRARATTAQASLSRTARRENLKGAFTVRHELNARHVIIVDDVMTTGSTADELAQALKAGGAAKVSVLVVARAAR
jgi:ComF family protein